MTPEQRVELIQAISKQRAFEYVDQLLAQARADGMETAAKICDERAEWLRSNGHTLKAEQSETLAAAIRARKDA